MEKKNIPWKPITGSSQIRSVYYNLPDKILYILFRNRKAYSYEDVSLEEYKALIGSTSVGKYFHSKIKTEKTWQEIN